MKNILKKMYEEKTTKSKEEIEDVFTRDRYESELARPISVTPHLQEVTEDLLAASFIHQG